MSVLTDIGIIGTAIYLLPVKTRVPLKFGTETLTHIICARVCLRIKDAQGKTAEGWGETPLSVQWVWPSNLPYKDRYESLKQFCVSLTEAYVAFDQLGHPMEIGHAFQQRILKLLLEKTNTTRTNAEPIPWLAALMCCAPFDIALHDAHGMLHQLPTPTAATGSLKCI